MAFSRSLARIAASAIGLSDVPRRDPARILVPLLLPIGDLLFCQPAIASLRRRYPQAHMTALVRPLLAPLITDHPDLDDAIIYDAAPDHDFITRLDTTLQDIYARRFDMIVSFSPAGNCVAILTGIPRQVWQRLPYIFWLWGDALDRGYRARHAVEHYWNVVRQLGVIPRGPGDHIPRWQVSQAERGAAREHLRSVGVDCAAPQPVMVMHPGAAGYGGRKRWPAEAFGALANELIAQEGAQIVVLGGADDAAAADTIVAITGGRAVSLAGQTPLRESVAISANAGVYIGCDSGLTHFAAALAVPTVAIFGLSALAQFAPRPVCPDRLRLVTPEPLPPPVGYFIGTESGLFAPKHPPDDRMAAITVAQARAAVAALQTAPALD
jgi:ADP-heptose:LPS heptosyltransferase